MPVENVQIYPSHKRIVPNFKLVKVISNLSDKSYNRLIDGKNADIVEKRKTKKHVEVVSTFTISNSDGYDNSDPLDILDHSVASVCYSEYEEGNRYITDAMILRGLTGKVGKNTNGLINKDQQFAIMESVKKLMSTIITIDQKDANQSLGYEAEDSITSTILPACLVTKKINGQEVENVIFFDREPPLLAIAKARKQILTYDVVLLDVPNQNNTPLVIIIKNYVIQRVMEIIKHKMTPTLTLDDIFEKCRIANAHPQVKARARAYIEEFLTHLQNQKVIKSFQWTKKANKFYSVKLTY